MNSEIGRRIRKLRLTYDLSQAEVASLLHISVNHYGYVERGERSLSLARLMQICELYDVSLDYLVFGKEK